MDRRIAIGCDHGGFALKKELIPFIDSLGYETIDIGCYDENSVDYPDVAFSLAEKVGSGEISRGIIVCGHRREHMRQQGARSALRALHGRNYGPPYART